MKLIPATFLEIMRHINGAYTTYFNVKRARSGHLFQGRHKAILVERDEYAKELLRYSHINPVRVKLVEAPEDYVWSISKSMNRPYPMPVNGQGNKSNRTGN